MYAGQSSPGIGGILQASVQAVMMRSPMRMAGILRLNLTKGDGTLYNATGSIPRTVSTRKQVGTLPVPTAVERCAIGSTYCGGARTIKRRPAPSVGLCEPLGKRPEENRGASGP